MQVDADSHILPAGVIVLCNHSCEPNCGVLIRSGVKELELKALRTIAAGEALTVDYETFEYEIEYVGGQCLCGSPKCRGLLSGYKQLPVAAKARYGEFVAEYLRAQETEVTVPVGA